MASKTMQAVQYDSYGGGVAGLKHVEISIPSPNKNEVLLKVEAASINPADWKIQSGKLRPFLPSKFPFIPVTDVAGEIVEVGPGVQDLKVGDKVVSMLKVLKAGGLAEYAVAPVDRTVVRPLEVSPAEGAGLPIAAGTALHALMSLGVRFDGTSKPSNVIVTAASGGVGSYAVQLAKLAGLHVTATCGARNVDLVRSLGADEVLDYKTPEGAALRSPSGRTYDLVVQCADGLEWPTIEPNLSTYAKVADIVLSRGTMLKFVVKKLTFAKQQVVPLVYMPKKDELKFLVELVGERKLKTVVDSRHLMSSAEAAWAKCMDGHATGKVIVEM